MSALGKASLIYGFVMSTAMVTAVLILPWLMEDDRAQPWLSGAWYYLGLGAIWLVTGLVLSVLREAQAKNRSSK